MTDEYVPGVEKPEELYKELEDLGAELGIPVPQVHLGLVVTDADGNVIESVSHRSRSFVRNFYNMIFCMGATAVGSGTYGAGSLMVRNGSGTDRSMINGGGWAVNPNGPLSCVNQSTTNGFGIVVGTGSTAESFEHTTMATLVASGGSAGQLNYQAMARSAASYTAGTKTWSIVVQRMFSNGSGGTIGVNEVGLVYQFRYNNAFDSALAIRDLLGATVNVVANATLTVNYTFTMVYPA